MSASLTPPPAAGGGAPPPPAPGGAPSGSPPIGSSPMTGPTQNLGSMAQGMQLARALVDGMAMILSKVGASTPVGQAISKAIADIGKHLPPDNSGPNDGLKQLALKATQMAPHKAAMGAAAPAPPGGMPPKPPMAA